MNPNDRRIDYIELPATSAEAAKQFYASVFGWKFTDYGPTYTAFEDGRINGGFQAAADRADKPLIVIYAADLEAMLRSVRESGGSITREIFSFPGGWRFHFVDPVGNEMAVWSE